MHKIPLTFKWTYLQGDREQFMQRSIELEPVELFVAVELEANPKYFNNQEINKYWADVKVAKVTGGRLPKFVNPVKLMLTPEGVAEARRLVNEAFEDKTQSDNDWGDDEIL